MIKDGVKDDQRCTSGQEAQDSRKMHKANACKAKQLLPSPNLEEEFLLNQR
jgi:hypothetical protein